MADPGLDHPGYLRHCAFPLCTARFHAVLGPAAGWLMGHVGPISTSYFCPAHAPLITGHIPRWLPGRKPGGTGCECGWEWLPQTDVPMRDHRQAWLLHLQPANETADAGTDTHA